MMQQPKITIGHVRAALAEIAPEIYVSGHSAANTVRDYSANIDETGHVVTFHRYVVLHELATQRYSTSSWKSSLS